MKTRSALSYFGSDSEVAGQLAALLDGCSHVTIPFVGGASIIPHIKARAIVANDKHAQAMNFYRFISGRFGQNQKQALIEKCQATLSHSDELALAKFYLDSPHLDYSLNQAWAFWAQCWIGRKGKGGTKHMGGMPSIRWTADGGTNASRITSAAEDLTEWAEHFKRCEWVEMCFRDLIPKVKDKAKCGIYIDAPWVGAGDNYLHSFAPKDHRDLAEELDRFEVATVVVRYGDAPLIRELYPAAKWTWVSARSRTQSNAVRDEFWIVRNVEGIA